MIKPSTSSPRHRVKSRHYMSLEQTTSSPTVTSDSRGRAPRERRSPDGRTSIKSPREHTASESQLVVADALKNYEALNDNFEGQGDLISPPALHSLDNMKNYPTRADVEECPAYKESRLTRSVSEDRGFVRLTASGRAAEQSEELIRQIKDIHNDSRKSARIIRDCKARVQDLQKKKDLTESDLKELNDRTALLLREMTRFEKLTRALQKVVSEEVAQKTDKRSRERNRDKDYSPRNQYEPPIYHEMTMNHPSVVLGCGYSRDLPARSQSEVDLTRRLNESYDMQEKLVADNADLEVKRYVLYKELMSKDQNLETCRSQIKRLQGELKILAKENALLQDRISKNCPEGDAPSLLHNAPNAAIDEHNQDKSPAEVNVSKELVVKLEHYKTSTLDLEKQLGHLEYQINHVRADMEAMKGTGRACHGGQGVNTCFSQPPGGPPFPPMSKECGVCPACPAPCNPHAVQTPAEKEVTRLSIQLKQTEENFKTKVTECAMLRSDLLRKKEELEKERCQHREVQNRLRELEMRFEGLATVTNMTLGTKEQAFENEVNVRTLKQCYREAREEIEELRVLMKEQNDQLQDYRVKYLQAQQTVEEQRRQMDLMDMDNTRISEQINLEIQRVKLKFQEKLQELAPLPDLLKATQMRLKDAQQSQAIAEHNAEQLARELNCAREKVHVLLHTASKPPEKAPEKNDDKQIQLLQQRVTQLTEANMATKSEIERLKNNVIRMEEAVLASDKRLQEKMHECAALGGELDRARDEAARALQRANERTETMRKCLQTTVAELERQLASSRAQVALATKEREELQHRMQCQIQRLNDNFEQAQYRILGLTSQVQTLRKTVSADFGDGEGDDGAQECACKSFFDDNK